jgi:hypothetical protein
MGKASAVPPSVARPRAIPTRWSGPIERTFDRPTLAQRGHSANWPCQSRALKEASFFTAQTQRKSRPTAVTPHHTAIVDIYGNVIPTYNRSIAIAQRFGSALYPTIAAIYGTPTITHDEGVAGLETILCSTLNVGAVFGVNQFFHYPREIVKIRFIEPKMFQISLADVSQVAFGRPAPYVDRQSVDQLLKLPLALSQRFLHGHEIVDVEAHAIPTAECRQSRHAMLLRGFRSNDRIRRTEAGNISSHRERPSQMNGRSPVPPRACRLHEMTLREGDPFGAVISSRVAPVTSVNRLLT